MLANFLLFPCVNFLLFLLLLPNVFVNVGAREVGNGDENYTVVFDAGSSETRVHVFKFKLNKYKHDLIHRSIEIYDEAPGLGSYDDPKKAADSINPLLHEAFKDEVIPMEARSLSHLQLGATKGLTQGVEKEKLDNILDAVDKLFRQESSSLLYKKENCKVEKICINREGAYMWVAMNYLLKSLGKEYSETVGVINLGGDSVEMSYAVDPKTIKDISSPDPETVKKYITKHKLEGMIYHLYVHSYSGYGQDEARENIKESIKDDPVNYCNILEGSNEPYPYNGTTYIVSSASTSNFEKCKENVERVLGVKAKFDGVWNGGGGKGQSELYLASAFFSTAQVVNITDPEAENGTTTLAKFKENAIDICALKSLEEAKKNYPHVPDPDSNLKYICMDLVYQYILLTDGFGLAEDKRVTFIRKVNYKVENKEFYVNATWALGSAIETVSGVASTKTEANNMFRFWSHAYTE